MVANSVAWIARKPAKKPYTAPVRYCSQGVFDLNGSSTRLSVNFVNAPQANARK